MRHLPLLALLLVASAHAQVRFELTDPLLLIDGQRRTVEGAPVVTPDFDRLEVEVPSWGTLLVSNRPFEGARRAGDFDRTRLVLVVNGRSFRLRSQTPLLNDAGPVPAYVRLDANPLTPSEGPVHLRLAPVARPQARPPAERPTDPAPVPPSSTTDELTRQLEALRAERDQLRSALAQTERERDDGRLRLAALREEVERLRLEVRGEHQPVNQLRAERDALQEEVRRLRASLEALGTPPAQPPRMPTNPVEPEATARVSLPDFDLSRLYNRAEILDRLDATRYPEWAEASRIGGDVLVLFQTDANGSVVRTAVPRPLGGGLDALAEEIVRAMRFIPVRADGQPTGLRSQVVVRFTP